MTRKPNYTDAALIEMLKSGSTKERKKALTHFYTNYFQSINSYVTTNSGNAMDAKDIFQESVVVMYENIIENRYQGKSTLKTYLFGISRNIWLKKLRNRLPLAQIKVLNNGELELPVEQYREISNEGRTLVQTALDKLDPDSKKILTEYYFNQRSMKELQSIFNLGSEQAAKNKKMRCLKKLIGLFNQYELDRERFFND